VYSCETVDPGDRQISGTTGTGTRACSRLCTALGRRASSRKQHSLTTDNKNSWQRIPRLCIVGLEVGMQYCDDNEGFGGIPTGCAKLGKTPERTPANDNEDFEELVSRVCIATFILTTSTWGRDEKIKGQELPSLQVSSQQPNHIRQLIQSTNSINSINFNTSLPSDTTQQTSIFYKAKYQIHNAILNCHFPHDQPHGNRLDGFSYRWTR
jgi:hypothetical protein